MGSETGIVRRARNRLVRAAGQFARHPPSGVDGPLLLRVACESLLTSGLHLTIVQVGANDGLHNDPVNPVVTSYWDRTRLLLVEPQNLVIPHLRDTYAGHPNIDIVNGAIGPTGSLDLFVIDPSHWEDCQPRYAADWPTYRAPTGVTSSSRDHVSAWLAKYYNGDLPIDRLILRQSVPCMPLPHVLSESGFPPPDILVVDTEGYDDVVLQHSALETLRPAVVFFEHAHVGDVRRDALLAHLTATGYTTYAVGDDSLALRTGTEGVSSSRQKPG